MPSLHCNDLVLLRHNRVRSSTNDERIVCEHSTEQSRLTKLVSKNRRTTLIGLPSSLINTSNEDLQNSTRVRPSVIYYNEESYQEVCYRSIEDIRPVNTNECLWIDVTGVS